MATIGKDLDYACELLMEGEVIGLPTETVYGLAGDATREIAIERIYAVKKRPATNPLIVHVAGSDHLAGIVSSIPENALKLMDRFWPGPLTFLLPKAPTVHHAITAGQPRVAVRMPAHPLALELLRNLPFPLAAPSANPYGYISPTTVQHVNDQLGSRIKYILDGGPSSKGIESTIIGFDDTMPIIYRKGVITDLDIQAIIGKVKYFESKGIKGELLNEEIKGNNLQIFIDSEEKVTSHITSGMSLSHYAPKTPLYLLPDLGHKDVIQNSVNFNVLMEQMQIYETLESQLKYKIKEKTARIGIISLKHLYFSQNICENLPIFQIELSPVGDLKEAASNLYGALHQLDQLELDVIFAECMPEEGIGSAINDRLGRAAVR